MAIVPRANPDLRINPLPQVRNEARVRPAEGLTQVAGQFSGIAMDFAQREIERNNVTALMSARRQLSDWEAQTFDPGNAEGVLAYKGKNAAQLNDTIAPKLDSRIAEIRQGLTRDQQVRFDEIAFSFRDSVQSRMNTHAAREIEAYRAEEHKALVGNLTNDAIGAAIGGDEGVKQARTAEALAANRAMLTADGASEEVMKAADRAIISGVHVGAVNALIGRDPRQAKDYLDRYGDDIDPETRLRIDATLRPLVMDEEFRALAPEFIRGGEVEQVISGDTVSGVAPRTTSALQATFRALASTHDTRITSMVRPVIGAGAGARSQHPKGTAADFSVKGMTREEIDELIADGRAAGLEVIDESDGKTGTGPHIHMELPPPGKRDTRRIVREAPAVLGDALAAVRADPRSRNPYWRKGMEDAVTREWALKERDEADRDSASLDRYREMAANAAPGTTPAKLYGREWIHIQSKGWGPTVETILKAGVEGKLIETNPVTYDRWKRLAVTNPAEFAKPQTKKAILESSGELGTSHLNDLLTDHAALNDPAKRAGAQADWASEAERLQAAAITLGYDRLEGEAATTRKAELGIAYRQARRAAIEAAGGKKLTPAQEDELVNSVVRKFAASTTERGKQSVAGRQAVALESFAGKVPADQRARIRAVLRAELGTEPTENEVLRYAARRAKTKSAQ